MKIKNWEGIQEYRECKIEMAGDFSVIVDPYLWKRLKNDDCGDDDADGCRYH